MKRHPEPLDFRVAGTYPGGSNFGEQVTGGILPEFNKTTKDRWALEVYHERREALQQPGL